MRFEIRALGPNGIVLIALDAADKTSALALAEAQGLAVLSARPRRRIGRMLVAGVKPRSTSMQPLSAG